MLGHVAHAAPRPGFFTYPNPSSVGPVVRPIEFLQKQFKHIARAVAEWWKTARKQTRCFLNALDGNWERGKNYVQVNTRHRKIRNILQVGKTKTWSMILHSQEKIRRILQAITDGFWFQTRPESAQKQTNRSRRILAHCSDH